MQYYIYKYIFYVNSVEDYRQCYIIHSNTCLRNDWLTQNIFV